MADSQGEGYLSIGEVLGLLLEEFPDVTISKIRFLESQGLISPERTASGYRKFYDDDVDLLRVILTEQRQNFLPLRVIKNRLETGEIDPTGEHLRPDGEHTGETPRPTGTDDPASAAAADVPSRAVASHPAASVRSDGSGADASEPDDDPTDPTDAETTETTPTTAGPDAATPEADNAATQLLPGVLLDRQELCSMVGMTESELDQLEDFGVIQPVSDGGATSMYDDDAVEIAKPACAFLRAGIDARHLRTFRTAAEREASLYEQIITPRFRHRNPESRAEALAQLRQLDGLGAKLRSALTKQALAHHFKS
jgi:DNA-binding transcriptional MerR regulator